MCVPVRSLHFSSSQRGWGCKSAISLLGFTASNCMNQGRPKCARPLQSLVRSFNRYSTAVASELHASVFFFFFFPPGKHISVDNSLLTHVNPLKCHFAAALNPSQLVGWTCCCAVNPRLVKMASNSCDDRFTLEDYSSDFLVV